MSRNIIAGPWLGEFGWELMRWQGIFRKLSYNLWNIYMVGKRDHEALYKDYVTKYIAAEDLGFHAIGPTNGWRINGVEPLLTKLQRDSICAGAKYVSPVACMRVRDQEFIKYEPFFKGIGTDIAIHARSTSKEGTDIRNWPEQKWEILVNKLHTDGIEYIHSIGSIDGAYHIPGTIDYRGRSLEDLIGVLYSKKLVVGPSSGPMHLASLCGTPHLVWTDKQFWGSCNGTNRDRYERNWNPLGTAAYVLDEYDWQPPIKAVYNKIKEILSEI